MSIFQQSQRRKLGNCIMRFIWLSCSFTSCANLAQVDFWTSICCAYQTVPYFLRLLAQQTSLFLLSEWTKFRNLCESRSNYEGTLFRVTWAWVVSSSIYINFRNSQFLLYRKSQHLTPGVWAKWPTFGIFQLAEKHWTRLGSEC